MRFFLLICLIFGLSANAVHAQSAVVRGRVQAADTERGLVGATVLIEETGQYAETNAQGAFVLTELVAGQYTLTFFAKDYKTRSQALTLAATDTLALIVRMSDLAIDLNAVEIQAQGTDQALTRLNNVDGFGIYAAKKSEVIQLDRLVANLATNNARQVYKGIAGLNIWESDGAGLQLSIGARGLDPNRTSNFNTRQNGYDISADALGYPESYYTPPTQALERIEIVRGAASLQYGPQFGGLLNFIFKQGNPTKPLEWVSEQTVGSFGLFTSFNSVGGTHKGWNYYGFFQYRTGDGWRPNSAFDQRTGYASLQKTFGESLTVRAEYTHMHYLAQQPGGLQDFEFAQDARQSKRTRNWFLVDWNLAALRLDYQLNDRTKLNNRTFVLDAQRQALGELGPINRPDPMRERDLIRGQYTNWGNETRLIHRYTIGEQYTTFLAGARYYQGFTTNEQGKANDGAGPDFTFLNPNDLEQSDYEFPSRNVSVFAENLFNVTDRLTVTPGARFEYIRTASDGYYKERVISGGQVIFEQRYEDARENERSLLLLGIGAGYRLRESVELYANFSQNYRSINFSDLAVVNPNLIIDSLLRDERGYNVDAGVRGSLLEGAIRLDASVFCLQYRDRIGVGEIVVPDPAVVEKAVAYRTNIGDARILGLEAYAECDVLRVMRHSSKDWKVSAFVNFSMLQGKYTSGASDFKGNDVELIPPMSLKTGLNVGWKSVQLAYQYAYTATHFSDATNATQVVDATRGLIPAYSVQDLSLSAGWKWLKVQAGINNLLDARYFTRRAVAYPGPGIIPADGRSAYLGLRWTI